NEYFDLIILDVMLPEMDGFETVKQIRKDFETPVVMLTARGEVTDKIVGLELGADDYMPKPFEPRELLARIQSVLRRSELKLKKN
ncbi:MAG TPA: response regulator, partial [Ignavibacteria bacterium]|nr:response regulator [Ignavibacteria bacterium]